MIKKHLFLLVLLCCLTGSAFAQKSARISGTITSDSEGPLIMVNVTERDQNNRIIEACITDFEGNFSMVVKNTSNVLEISYVGYKTQRLEIGNRTVFNVNMVEDNVLAEVEIVAKQRSRSGGLDILDREMTHATQKISMDEMDGLSFASVDEALQGQIAGLDVVFASGDVGAGTQMRIRGNSGLEGSGVPLLVVDDNIFEVITWPKIQDLYDKEGFKENTILINDEKGLEEYGGSAYFVRKRWLHDLHASCLHMARDRNIEEDGRLYPGKIAIYHGKPELNDGKLTGVVLCEPDRYYFTFIRHDASPVSLDLDT